MFYQLAVILTTFSLYFVTETESRKHKRRGYNSNNYGGSSNTVIIIIIMLIFILIIYAHLSMNVYKALLQKMSMVVMMVKIHIPCFWWETNPNDILVIFTSYNNININKWYNGYDNKICQIVFVIVDYIKY